jgi:hypothetical protein
MSKETKDFTDSEFAASSIINQLAEVCYARSKEKGFWNDQEQLLALVSSDVRLPQESKKRLLKVLNGAFTSQKNDLIHSELGEATEAQRKELLSDKIAGFSGEEEEYADAIIRILDLAARKKMRLGEAIVRKMRYNEGREYMHGKKF